MKHIRLLWSALLVGSLVTVAKADLGGQHFAPSGVVGSETLPLRGAGLLKVRVIFKVYAAALYLPATVASERYADDVPKRIEIAYLRDLDAGIIIKAGDDALKRSLTPEQQVTLRPRLEAINRLYVDVRAGDRYALTYEPGRGSTLSLNGRDLGTIEGADFAAAYFGIWLDHRSDFPDFRAALLGLDA